MEGDAHVDEVRAQISALDRSIFEAVNRRLELVAELKRYKDEHGLAFVDPERESRMVAEQVQANGGISAV